MIARRIIVGKKPNEIIINFKNFEFIYDYNEHANDFFQRLALFFNLSDVPKFSDSDFIKFYNFWKRFNHKDKALELKVRNVIWKIRESDPRVIKLEKEMMECNKMIINNNPRTIKLETSNKMNTNNKDININKINVVREPNINNSGSKTNVRPTTHECVFCNKKFKSENTFKDHLMSKGHKLKAYELLEDEINDKGEILKNNPGENEKTQDINMNVSNCYPEENEKTREINMNVLNCRLIDKSCKKIKNELNLNKDKPEEINKNKDFSRIIDRKNIINESLNIKRENITREEHVLLRTCGECKRIFRSRGDLIFHIKKEH